MSCLSASIRRYDAGVIAHIVSEDLLKAQVATTERPRVKVGIVCSLHEELAIRFAKDKLVWEGETNAEGVVKYNTLISTGEWSLEEITIEELL